MPTWLKMLITEADNYTFDIVRILAVVAVVQFLCSELYILIKISTFDAISFGTGIGAVLIATGAALKLKPDEGGQSAITTA